MTDTRVRVWPGCQGIVEALNGPYRFAHHEFAPAVQRDSGRVVSAVFENVERVEQDCGCVPWPDVTCYAAHDVVSLAVEVRT
ncbi:hypothetical protein [Rhodococcus sp. H29-C3]|uniref:hypothetical protein n=1 Tax=Rhodococcus sp. H29-C3 TaxID=3046307 RepID=UPI0024B89C42|nr:hypothetical protein [Rhodococcus sp. H29-C3]MDJ0362536.1 hypothetical protein [Rhodococcus sp. H29-C3]